MTDKNTTCEVPNKAALRKKVRELKRQFSSEELIKMSEPLIQKVLSHPRMGDAKVVMLYNSLGDEVYTHKLIRLLSERGKRILLPVVIGDTEMEVRELSENTDFEESSYGIMEPKGKAFTNFDEITFALVPGMGFDKDYNRLGRGKGYYDRFLPLLTKAYKVGICFPFQVLDKVPTDEFDKKVDELICD